MKYYETDLRELKTMRQIKKLEDETTLDELFQKPNVLLFKNSMNCGISRSARGQLERFAVNCDDPVDIYMVDVISDKALSRKIAERTGITHESPQAICLKNGKVSWHASHFKITEEELKKAVEKND
jgi:bacillithiol system protein YtxJ